MGLNDLRVSIREVSGGERAFLRDAGGQEKVPLSLHPCDGSSFAIRLMVLVVRCMQMCVWQYLEIV